MVAAFANRPKQLLTLRLDPGVIAWFRSRGPGWQTRMGEALQRAARPQRESAAFHTTAAAYQLSCAYLNDGEGKWSAETLKAYEDACDALDRLRDLVGRPDPFEGKGVDVFTLQAAA